MSRGRTGQALALALEDALLAPSIVLSCVTNIKSLSCPAWGLWYVHVLRKLAFSLVNQAARKSTGLWPATYIPIH